MRNGKNFFVYLWQIRRKLFSWYVGEKNVGLDKRRQASQKEHVLSLKRLYQLKLSTRSFANSGTRELTLKCKFKCYLNPWITHWALALVKGNREPHEAKKKSFDLGGNRTHDLRNRSTVTLPTELQGRTEKVGDDFRWWIAANRK